MTMFYIVLIISIFCIIVHILVHLIVIFHQDTTDLCVKKVLEDPHKYVRIEEMCYVLRNMLSLFFACLLLYITCSGNMKIEKSANAVEISNIKDK